MVQILSWAPSKVPEGDWWTGFTGKELSAWKDQVNIEMFIQPRVNVRWKAIASLIKSELLFTTFKWSSKLILEINFLLWPKKIDVKQGWNGPRAAKLPRKITLVHNLSHRCILNLWSCWLCQTVSNKTLALPQLIWIVGALWCHKCTFQGPHCGSTLVTSHTLVNTHTSSRGTFGGGPLSSKQRGVGQCFVCKSTSRCAFSCPPQLGILMYSKRCPGGFLVLDGCPRGTFGELLWWS